MVSRQHIASLEGVNAPGPGTTPFQLRRTTQGKIRSSSPTIACTKVQSLFPPLHKIPYLHYSTPGAVANRTMTKLDDQIAQHRKELECHVALFDLAETLRKRSEETSAVADLGEAIALHRSALDLRQTGHPDRHWSLSILAWCLDERCRRQGMPSHDLEEAILLERVIPIDGTHSINSHFIYVSGTINLPLWQIWRKLSHSTEPRWISVKVTLIMP